MSFVETIEILSKDALNVVENNLTIQEQLEDLLKMYEPEGSEI